MGIAWPVVLWGLEGANVHPGRVEFLPANAWEFAWPGTLISLSSCIRRGRDPVPHVGFHRSARLTPIRGNQGTTT